MWKSLNSSNSGLLLTTIILGFFSLSALSQEIIEPKKNRISAVMGYILVPDQVEDTDGKIRIVPSFGLDYIRVLSPKWAIGLINDIELTSYYIHDPEKESGLLEREFAFISSVCVFYRIIDEWTVFIGAGYEFETNQNFYVTRLGTEYEVPIRNDWDVSFGLNWDYKEIYNSFGFNVAFGKRF